MNRIRAWLLLKRAARCVRRHKYDTVMPLCNRVLDLTPGNALAYALRAHAWYSKSEFSCAIDDSNEVLRRRPNVARAYNTRGASRLRLGDLNQALADFNEAVCLKPAALYLSNRGATRRLLGDFTGALADLLGSPTTRRLL